MVSTNLEYSDCIRSLGMIKCKKSMFGGVGCGMARWNPFNWFGCAALRFI